MEEDIINFCAITSADPDKAAQYLRLTENNLEQAIQLFFDSPNLDVGGTAVPSQPAREAPSTAHNPIQIDSDDDMDYDPEPTAPAPPHANVDDDEAMARRLQEEMYGGAIPGEADVRAPIARTSETLVGPGSQWEGEDDIDALVAEQMAARRRPAGRLGIFNQQQRATQSSVWDNSGDSSARRRELATATGGASETSSKSNMLAEMYRPPFEIMFQQPWDKARELGREELKWILVNIQDPAIFDCQILNRDIWKNDDIKATVRENFIFMQYSKDDPRGQQYINYYFQNKDSQDAYPHIGIVDPRTGERVKVWSGPPMKSAVEFHAELHEFLDRYSLNVNAKNPVANRKPAAKKVDINRMTEEEMLEMALQNSIGEGKGPKDDDPDALTRDSLSADKGKGKAQEEDQTEEPAANGAADSAFAQISDTNIHIEPTSSDPKITTRIKFTASGESKVRKFNLSDPVRTIYEWIKAGGWESKEGIDFDLIFMRKNLIDVLDSTIEEAGLKMGRVDVEFAE